MNEARWQPRDWRHAALAALAGLLLAILPHLANRAAYGTWDFLADQDDVWFVAQARAAWHGESDMRDPLCRIGEQVPSFYSWWQFVPWGYATRWLGLPLLRILMLWRSLGGLFLGGVLYHVHSLLLPVGAPTPIRAGPWRVLARTDQWTLYSR